MLRGIDLEALSCRQVAACARALLADPTTLLARHYGADGYSLDQHLGMLLLDALRVANWQRSKDGSKGRNRPRPVSPLARAAGETTYGGARRAPSVSPERARAFLDSIGPRAVTAE